jgi:hypothetical protein
MLLATAAMVVLVRGASAGVAASGIPVKPVAVPGMTCSNAELARGQVPYADSSMPPGWSVIYATVLQRHWDRWLYPHPLIENNCWPKQLNSTAQPMPEQCLYNMSNVWEIWSKQADPYSIPAYGSCACPQLTQVGKDHALALGQTLERQYGSIINGCREGAVGLETEKQQKNEMSLQMAFHGAASDMGLTEASVNYAPPSCQHQFGH